MLLGANYQPLLFCEVASVCIRFLKKVWLCLVKYGFGQEGLEVEQDRLQIEVKDKVTSRHQMSHGDCSWNHYQNFDCPEHCVSKCQAGQQWFLELLVMVTLNSRSTQESFDCWAPPRWRALVDEVGTVDVQASLEVSDYCEACYHNKYSSPMASLVLTDGSQLTSDSQDLAQRFRGELRAWMVVEEGCLDTIY
uniref:Uncharacterized protein n=1 Tax=Timema tahoe TaxID=61484 RepID=A0A7R9IRU3_9NEOP|nr:unnamed protein product [Timema tahoe]